MTSKKKDKKRNFCTVTYFRLLNLLGESFGGCSFSRKRVDVKDRGRRGTTEEGRRHAEDHEVGGERGVCVGLKTGKGF